MSVSISVANTHTETLVRLLLLCPFEWLQQGGSSLLLQNDCRRRQFVPHLREVTLKRHISAISGQQIICGVYLSLQ